MFALEDPIPMTELISFGNYLIIGLSSAQQAPTYILYLLQVRQKAGVEHTRLLRGGRPLHPHPLPHHRHHRIGGMLAR